jgi:hypothetical protein
VLLEEVFEQAKRPLVGGIGLSRGDEGLDRTTIFALSDQCNWESATQSCY